MADDPGAGAGPNGNDAEDVIEVVEEGQGGEDDDDDDSVLLDGLDPDDSADVDLAFLERLRAINR